MKTASPFRAPRFVLFGALAVTVACGLPRGGAALATDTTVWLTDRAMQSRLAEPLGVAWVGAPLRATLADLARSRRVALWLDRRVDPSREINLAADGMPLRNVLGRVAQQAGLGVGRFDAVVFLGPPGSLSRLRAAAAERRDEAKRLPAATARKFHQAKPMRWDDFATPRDLLAELAASSGIRLVGVERLPHDLWPAADLPPMSLVDRLSLILAQFDLTFEFTARGRGIRLAPMPPVAELPPPAETWETVDPVKKKKPRRDAQDDLARVRIDKFAVEDQPLGEVLRQLAARLKIELRIDDDSLRKAGKSLDRRVSFRVEKVTVDALFETMLRGEGLAFRRQGRTVEIFAAD